MDAIEKTQEELRDHVNEDNQRFASHQKDILEIKKALREINTKLDPVLDVYKAAILSKSFLTGVGAIVLAITAIGTFVVWVVKSIK